MIASTSRELSLGLLSVGLLLLLGSLHSVHAQSDDLPTVTHTYALENARVVQAPGEVLESATVVIRDGLIERVGADVEIPYDARRIEGDSLVVYAGFIDGLSHAGVDTPDPEDQDVEHPGDPPPDRAGIQPDRSVRSMLSPNDSDLDRLRKAGFTAAQVAPEGEMLPGSSALVLYGGETPDDMLLDTEQSLFAQIQPARGSYPNTIYPSTDMAVIAQFRQLYREADRRQSLEENYTQDRTGQPRPPRDPVHTAFFPVLDGESPVAFYADEALSIHRILSLQEELNFPLTLAGLGESFNTVDALQNADASLFLTLNLPEEPERTANGDTTVADTTNQPERHYSPDFRTETQEDVDDEETNLELRHAMERQKYLETADTLEEAGLQFGFTTREAKPQDLRGNLRTMIEHGLSEETALAALTTRPATLLGLDDRLGTVESGKIANLVVTDGSYFKEDTSVRHVFVDGRQYEYTEEEEGDDGEVTGDVSAVLGTWSYTLESPRGETSGTFTIEGDESGLEGTFSGPNGEEEDMQSLSFDGSTLSFEVTSPQGETVTVSVTIQGETFEGTASGSFGSFPITGERVSQPDR